VRIKTGLVAIIVMTVGVLAAVIILATAEHYYDFVVFNDGSRVKGAAISDRGFRLLEVRDGRIRTVGPAKSGNFNRLEAFYNDGKHYIAGITDNSISFLDKYGTKMGEISLNNNEIIIDTCYYPKEDSAEVIFLIIGEQRQRYGHSVRAYDLSGGNKEVYKRDMSEYNPWKIQTADVDGDGAFEVSVGVYKTARFHPVMAKRPFIYAWDGTDLKPKWLGSRLSRPFDDYAFADLNGDGADEIIAIERLEDNRCIVQAYEWTGFGFIGTAESAAADSYGQPTVLYGIGEQPDRFIVTREAGNRDTIDVLAYRNGKLDQESMTGCRGNPGRVIGLEDSLYYILDANLMVQQNYIMDN
jgi:hypothetical protein